MGRFMRTKTRSLSRAMPGVSSVIGLLGATLVGFAAGGACAQPFDAVTADEAAQAALATQRPASVPSITRGASGRVGPTIRVLAPPDPSTPQHPPLHLELAFVAASGRQIVPASFRVFYGPIRVDLTERLRRHATISAGGVVVDQAMMPEGLHRLYVQIADDRGAVSEHEIQIRVVAPKADAAAPTPRIAPLLGLIVQSLASEALHEAVTGEPSGLFKRLQQGRLFAPDKAEPPRPIAAGAAQRPTPAIGWAMELLDADTFATIRPIAVGNAEPPALRTGDVFAVQFSTNLPGIVRLENIDPAGQVQLLGTYPVLADQLNRIPRERGIRLEGEAGTERLRFFFRPCLHAAPVARSADERWSGQLPACSAAGAKPLLAAAQGEVTARRLVNLEQPDPTMSFAGTAEYKPDEVTLMEVSIRHEPRP